MKKKYIGFAGLGDIGSVMASRLVATGASVIVYNRTASRTEPLVALGATVAPRPADLAQADVVMTCLHGPQSDREVYEGDGGILSADVRGKVLINTATVGPSAARRLAGVAEARGAHYVDAPLLGGGVPAAAVGELLMPVGASPTAFELAKPYLDLLASRVEYLGAVGTAQAVKLVNNMQVAVASAILGDALNLALEAGIEKSTLARVLPDCSSQSRTSDRHLETMLFGPLAGRGTLKTLGKDLALAVEMCESSGLHSEIAAAALSYFAGTPWPVDADVPALIERPQRARAEVAG